MSSPEPDTPETPPPITYSTPPALIAFTLAVVVVCFICFTIVYFCRCCFVGIFQNWAFQRSTSGTLVNISPNVSPYRGLDPSLLQAFPTFLYASVKDLRKEKYSLECAICLLEFEEDSMMRLLTVCCHVFHQECIDLWLSSHKTCPVCRTDLDSPTNETRKSHELGEDYLHAEEERRNDVCIDVKEGEDDQRHDDEHVSMSMMNLQRAHSTGHSIVMIRGGDNNGGKSDDKYTLRLPEHVAVKIVRRGHNYTKSCSSYNEMTRPVAPCSNCGYVQTVIGSSSRSGTQNI
ncbi:RING-H2 finger protein ATL29-like [Gastrolobium bilobum]|uniref:RING-H2 finger protein ATL29-like n=1 Tax=Gastrolobium bilobum TaxID=150636 RepID=UPI002AB122EF|nr:RING-H2 finger protein ATL29-like [Gastrolobium bilobum]